MTQVNVAQHRGATRKALFPGDGLNKSPTFDLAQIQSLSWPALSETQTLQTFGSSKQVLTTSEAEARQALAGTNLLPRAGGTVAVNGDRVNVGPAAATANIGAAMGKNDTDVTWDAADLILTDDIFTSIIANVGKGHIAYDNVRKLIYLLITTGLGEILLFILAIAVGLPMPLTAVQLPCLNLVTNG